MCADRDGGKLRISSSICICQLCSSLPFCLSHNVQEDEASPRCRSMLGMVSCTRSKCSLFDRHWAQSSIHRRCCKRALAFLLVAAVPHRRVANKWLLGGRLSKGCGVPSCNGRRSAPYTPTPMRPATTSLAAGGTARDEASQQKFTCAANPVERHVCIP